MFVRFLSRERDYPPRVAEELEILSREAFLLKSSDTGFAETISPTKRHVV
jgi:hypothetical protein